MAQTLLGVSVDPPSAPQWANLGLQVVQLSYNGHIFIDCITLLFSIYFDTTIQKCCYHHDRTPERKLVCVDSIVWRASVQAPRPIFGSKFYFFALHPHNCLFVGSDGPDSMGSYLPHIFFSFFLTLLFNRNLATLALFPNGSPIKIVIVMYVHFYCLLNDRVPYFIFMSSAICGSAPRQC